MHAIRGIAGTIAAWCGRQPAESHADRLLRILVSSVVLLFPAACLLVDRSDSLSLLLMAMIGLLVWVRNGFRSGLTRSDWLFVAVFAGFFLAGVLGFELGHQTDNGFRLLGRYLRLLFVLPVLLALRRYRPPVAVVWTGLGLGASVLGLDAIWESMSAGGFLRPDGDTNVAILFGDLATLTTFAFAAGYIYIDGRLPRIGPYLVAGCVLLGLLASFLSGTRGAWIAMPVLLILFLSCRHLLRPRTVLLGSGAVVALFVLLVFLPETHILQRVEGMTTQIRAYWAASQGGDRSGTGIQCLDNATVLQSWIKTASGKFPPGSSISVMVEKEYAVDLGHYGCNHGAAVYMHNPSKELAWVILPRSALNGSKTASTRLLVRGVGYVGFFGHQYGTHPIYTRYYGQLNMSAPARYGHGLSIVLPAGDDLWLVPTEAYFGEYRYAALQGPVGQRLEMWWAAVQLFSRAPAFGIGTGAYQAETQKLVASGEAAPETADYDHPHSDYFDALASRGLVGLVALLLLLGMPAWLYAKGIDSHDPHGMGAALGGLLVATGFAIFGLTETMFIHSVTIGWYVIMTAVFLVSMDVPAGQDKGRR